MLSYFMHSVNSKKNEKAENRFGNELFTAGRREKRTTNRLQTDFGPILDLLRTDCGPISENFLNFSKFRAGNC